MKSSQCRPLCFLRHVNARVVPISLHTLNYRHPFSSTFIITAYVVWFQLLQFVTGIQYISQSRNRYFSGERIQEEKKSLRVTLEKEINKNSNNDDCYDSIFSPVFNSVFPSQIRVKANTQHPLVQYNQTEPMKIHGVSLMYGYLC